MRILDSNQPFPSITWARPPVTPRHQGGTTQQKYSSQRNGLMATFATDATYLTAEDSQEPTTSSATTKAVL